jgi:AraC-like DNA-binding protein/mannose-6-phosphate isomerase-like protein (cupin superfamily)
MRRSTEPSDYQNLAQPIGAMAKSFSDGYEIALHQHDRDQLLYAISGVMRLQTEYDAWIVPPDRAVYIPASLSHSVTMFGTVDMRTLYIAAKKDDAGLKQTRVHAVSELLRQLILALSDEPVDYSPNSRGDRIARLIELELARATELSPGIPLPNDQRLQMLCAAVLSDPADRRTLDDWALIVGASTRTLSRLFERDVGLNFNSWRQRVRFHNALEALSRRIPIARVAERSGYNSASAFSAAFKKQMGVLPSQVSQPSKAK